MSSQKGFAHILVLILLLAGLGAGVYLVTSGNPLKLFSKASLDQMSRYEQEYWVVPNILHRDTDKDQNGAPLPYIDWENLFKDESQWQETLSKVDVMGFFVDFVNENKGDWVPRAVSLLKKYNIAVAVEAGGTLGKAGNCTCDANNNPDQVKLQGSCSADLELAKISKIYESGGSLAYLSLDGPFLRTLKFVNSDPNSSCSYDLQQSTDALIAYMQRFHQVHPEVKIGLISNLPNWGYNGTPPYWGAYYNKPVEYQDVLESIVSAADKAGEKIAFVHVDNPYDFVIGVGKNRGTDVKDADLLKRITQLQDQTESHGIRFGLVYNSSRNGNSGTGNTGLDGKSFYDDTLAYINLYRSTGKIPSDTVIESWFPYPAKLTSGTESYTFSNLALQALAASSTQPKGFLDLASCDQIAGWSCDPDQYRKTTSVHFYKDGEAGKGGTFVGSAKADQPREETVKQACGGYAERGYSYPVPDSLKDGQEHAIYAYGLDTAGGVASLLLGSPKQITCISTSSPSPIAQPDTQSSTAMPFYRLNKNSYHLFTLSLEEKDYLRTTGWTYEGVAGYLYSDEVTGTVPVYRSYNATSSDHFYTTDSSERDQEESNGWKYEGIAGYIYSAEVENSVPFYILNNNGNHFYTSDKQEHDQVISSLGFKDEGILGYVLTKL